MRPIRYLSLSLLLVALSGGLALGQTDTPTPTVTSTPTNTATFTLTPTSTPTSRPAIPTISRNVKSKIQDFAPGPKSVHFGDLFEAVVQDTNDSVKVALVDGIDGSGGGAQYLTGLRDRASAVVTILAAANSGNAVTRLLPTTDYVLAADGRVEIASNQSAYTLIVFYRRQ